MEVVSNMFQPLETNSSIAIKKKKLLHRLKKSWWLKTERKKDCNYLARQTK